MTPQSKKSEATPNAPLQLPGPSLTGTTYSLIQPRSRLTEVIGRGRRFNNGEGIEGVIESITHMGSGVTRVAIKAGSGVFVYCDLWGEWFANVAEVGERWHTPKLVAPEVVEARKALLALDPKARAEVMDGFTPSAA